MSSREVVHGLDTAPPRPVPSDPVVESTWATLRTADIDGELQFRFDLMPDGSFVLRQLLFESHGAITSGLLAALPLQEVLRAVTVPADLEEQDELEQRKAQTRALLVRMGLSERAIDVLQRGAPARTSPRLGREGPTFEELEFFAVQYEIATRINPKRAIAMTMSALERNGITISRATANRWRSLAQTTEPPLLAGAKPPMRRDGESKDG